MTKIRYSQLRERIDVDAFEAAIGFQVIDHDKGNDIGYCVFPENHSHGDTTGKFAIHRDKLVYHCWVCGGGSLLSLVMELYKLDVDQATEWISQFAGHSDTRSDLEFHDYLLGLLEDIEERSETMPYFNERVLERFAVDYEYFGTRGISPEIVDKYNLRLDPHVMKSAPVKQGRDGIKIKIDDDYYGPVAIFPHYWQGKLVGWQHRWLDWDEAHTSTPRWLAKYTNTTDFPKHNTLFNYDNALEATEPVVVLESGPSVLFLTTHDVPAVGYFGGDQLKPPQLRLLRRFTQGVILAPDNDKTGDRFVNSATEYLERFIPVYHAEKVTLGPKADLGDYAKTNNPEANLREHLAQRVHLAGVEI